MYVPRLDEMIPKNKNIVIVNVIQFIINTKCR